MQQEISLYIDLHEGRKIDLERAAKAALAFDAAVKSIASAINPMVTVRLELESGTQGSLSLNSLLTAVGLERRDLKAVAVAVISFFALETAGWTIGQILDHVVATPEIHEKMSQEEKEGLANEIFKLIKSHAGEKEIGKVYQELQKDDAVKGVGVTTKKGTRPTTVVPRSEFQRRGQVVVESEASGTRTTSSVQTLTLVSPVLMQSSRKWKFRQGKIEFGAPIRDLSFLQRVLSGKEPVPMTDGITMKVVLTLQEEKVDGVWKIKSRTIDEVVEIHAPPEQLDILRPAG